MADAITAQWHGHNYQSRIFWLNAMDLLRPATCVSRVTFEANGPKAFDDVVVHYKPPVVRSGPDPIAAEYHQIKWHVETGGRLGYEDLTRPGYIGAKSFSLLERLRDAKQAAAGPARMLLVTPDRIYDGDPIGRLISANDHSLLTERLFDGTTDRSQMGKVRRCWREHLALPDNDALREVVEGLAIVEGYRTLQQLRDEINLKAETVGLSPCRASDSDFRYDELARQLKIRRVNAVNREQLIEICKAEGLWVGKGPVDDGRLPVAIRSFRGLSTDVVPAAPENTLWLTDSFRARYLNEDREWQRDILPRVGTFLTEAAAKSNTLRLILDAHASIAYLSGSVYHVKTGLDVEIVQKGRVGTQVWRPDDGSSGDSLQSEIRQVGREPDIAVAVSITQPVDNHVSRFVDRYLPEVGRLLLLAPPDGPGQRSVAGGEHAARMAEQASNIVRSIKAESPDATVHLFAACPNSFLYYLGQNHTALAPVVVYEFDFDRLGNKTYQPSFEID